jgi:uncharacterized phage protein gp47/JayE
MTATPPSNIPIAFDYTSKDYFSIREELIARVQDRVPNWTGSDPADFGIALVEAFAYMGDLLSYYIDRAANEAFLTTATQRESVLNIAQTYGYVPAGYRAATVELEFSNSSGSSVTIPESTVVSGEIVVGDTVQTIYFTTGAEAIVPAQVGAVPGTETVTATHGRSVILVSDDATDDGELIGTSTGEPGMEFELGETPVADGSIELYVQDGDIFTKWTQVQHIIDYGPTDQIFTVTSDEDNVVTVKFGDGVSGVIPTIYAEVRAKYNVGGGVEGNVDADTLTTLDTLPGLSEVQVSAIQSAITVNNPDVAVGGADPEETDQIRVAAALALRANNRAVTLQDYADLSIAVTGVGKANAEAAVWSSVTVYVAPTRNTTDSDESPGLDSLGNTTVEWDSLQTDVEDYLSDKILLGTSVTVSPPVYVDIVVSVDYTKLDQYTTAEVEAAIKSRLLTDFGYTGIDFQETLYPQDIEFSVLQVPGVKTARVTSFYKFGDSVALNTSLVAASDEIFRLKESNINLA